MNSAVKVFLLIVLGLASRKFGSLLPGFLQKNLGDVFWASMVFFLFAFLLPRASTFQLATVAFIFCCCIEVSKLFHALWFDALRSTGFGRLVFGYVFGWSNLACYFVGIMLGASWDHRIIEKRLRHSSPRQ